MRFRDMDHFREVHPTLAGLLEGPRGGSVSFLKAMKERVESRENMSPKMITAMKKFIAGSNKRTYKKGERWDEVEVEIVQATPNKDCELSIRRDGDKARIKVTRRQFNMCCDRLEALAHGETISAFIRGVVVWVSDDNNFPILEVDIDSISTVARYHFEKKLIKEEIAARNDRPEAKGFAPTGTSADEVFEPYTPPTMREGLLPDFGKWKTAKAFALS